MNTEIKKMLRALIQDQIRAWNRNNMDRWIWCEAEIMKICYSEYPEVGPRADPEEPPTRTSA